MKKSIKLYKIPVWGPLLGSYIFDFPIRFDYALLDLDSDSISIPYFDFDSGFDFDSHFDVDSFRSESHLKNKVDILARKLYLEFFS